MTDTQTTKTPAPDDVVQLKPKEPIKHNGFLYGVEDVIEAPFREVAHLVQAGVAAIERVLGIGGGAGNKSASKPAVQKAKPAAQKAASAALGTPKSATQSGASQ